MMTRFVKKQLNEIGRSPDELFFRGRQKIDKVLMRIFDFDSNNLTEDNKATVKDLERYNNKNTVTWINIDGLHNLTMMEEIATALNLDQVAIAEVLNTQGRPRILEFDNCTLISIKMLMLNDKTGFIEIENLSLVLTKSTLITFQEVKGDVFDPVRERIRKQKKRIRNNGTDYLTFALLDIVIDNYLYLISRLGEKIETLEDNLIINTNQDIINKINKFKQEINFLRKNIKTAKEMIFSLTKIESDFFSESTSIYFKELQESINQANDSSENYREILSDQLNIYHTTMSSKLNDIMKFLTVFSVIFIPLTFIAGIYGTNFDNIPELHYRHSYFIMWGVIIVVAILMLFYFKRKKWL